MCKASFLTQSQNAFLPLTPAVPRSGSCSELPRASLSTAAHIWFICFYNQVFNAVKMLNGYDIMLRML